MDDSGGELTDHPTGETEGLRIAATRASGAGGDAGMPTGRMKRTSLRGTSAVAPAVAPAPDAGRRWAPAGADGRAKVLRQRLWRRRLLMGLSGLTAFCTLLAGVVYVYGRNKLDQVTRVVLPALTEDVPGAVMNVLLVGSDSRANLEGAVAAGFGKGQVTGQRSDTVMILHIDPAAQKAAIVSVPRDMYVPIAGTTMSDRVNAAFALGGPDQLVATVQQALGITINHYVQIDFVGFKDIVQAVDGVTMYIPYQVRDLAIGLTLPAGCKVLDGQQGLSWVRSRSMEFLINGAWQADGRGDLGRIERQQDFIRRMMKKAVGSGLTNPIQLNRLIGVGVRDLTFDANLSTRDITALGRRFSSLDPDRVVLSTLPTSPADIDGKAVLKLQTAQAQPLIDLLNGKGASAAPPSTVPATGTGTTAAVPGGPSTTVPAATIRPSDVKVRILNGVGTSGAATKAATSLTAAGYVVADRADAGALAPKTTISYATGQLVKAQFLQSAMLNPAVLREDPTLKSVDINLLLGADYSGLKATVSTGTPATIAPTTAAPGTSAVSTLVAPTIHPVPLPKGTTVPPC